jgi:hypothetical protein
MLALATQSFGEVHGAPWTHATHAPDPLHTPPGHAVPAATLPDALHIGPPLAHEIVADVQGFPVEHVAPALHATHVPDPSHTPPGHDVPALALPVARHMGVPPLQFTVP